jgi:hypothetical protein
MAEFDPELYLRLLGERMVVRDHRGVAGRRVQDLFEAASALVTCGVMSEDVARGVLDGYTAAFGVPPSPAPTPLPPARPAPCAPLVSAGVAPLISAGTAAPRVDAPAPLPPRRVFIPDVEIDSRHGLGRLALHWIILTDTRVTVCLTATVPSPSALGAAPPRVELTTPAGERIDAVFSHVVEPGLTGDFEARATVRDEVDWLMIDGTRVELIPSPISVQIDVESRPASDPATALVWQLLADFTDGRGWADTGRPALAALTAAGVIAPDDPELAAIAWARHHAPPAQNGGTTPRPPAVATPPPPNVPPEWRGLARSRTLMFAGRSQTLAVGAVTPVFDGLSVAVDVVDSGIWGVLLEVEIAGLAVDQRWSELVRRPLAFWVRDDQDNWCLGRRQGWSQVAGSDVGHGTVAFAPLHPAATRLTVMATTATARAALEIPL